MSAGQKVVVVKAENRVTLRREMSDRDFWLSMREGLLQQLAVIEKKLGIERRCKHCGNPR